MRWCRRSALRRSSENIVTCLVFRLLVLPFRKSVLLVAAKTECYTSNRSTLVDVVPYANSSVVSGPMTVVIKVIVGHPEGIKEASQPLIGLLGILLIDGNIVPQLVVVATDVQCDFVSGLTVAENLIRNVADSYAMVARFLFYNKSAAENLCGGKI